MKTLSIWMAGAAIILAGCGDKQEAVAPEMTDQAAQEAVAEVVETETAGEQVAQTVATVSEQAPAAAVAEEPDLAQGKKIYSKNCFACHGSGAAGAPKLGDTENWAPRIAQGMDTMAGHAIAGYKGSAGYMPPKGGFMTLDDADVTAAVAYMVSESQ